MIKEQDIQKQLKEYLTLKGWMVIKNNTVGIFRQDTKRYIPNQSAGLADLTIIKKGRVIMIEVKREGNVQSDNQIEFEKNWKAKGGEYWLIYNLDELIEHLKKK
jgi:hypothetical protein